MKGLYYFFGVLGIVIVGFLVAILVLVARDSNGGGNQDDSGAPNIGNNKSISKNYCFQIFIFRTDLEI